MARDPLVWANSSHLCGASVHCVCVCVHGRRDCIFVWLCRIQLLQFVFRQGQTSSQLLSWPYVPTQRPTRSTDVPLSSLCQQGMVYRAQLLIQRGCYLVVQRDSELVDYLVECKICFVTNSLNNNLEQVRRRRPLVSTIFINSHIHRYAAFTGAFMASQLWYPSRSDPLLLS